MIQEWVGIAWHLKGAPTLAQWFEYTTFERQVICKAVVERIRRHNDIFDE